jgi:hypothetical protein
MKKLILTLNTFFFSYVVFAQTYTVKTETKGANYSAYTGNGTTTSTSVIQQTKTSADHFKDLQNNINNSMSNVSSSTGGQSEAEGIISLGNASFQITKVGANSLVGYKKLNRLATEEIESFAKKKLSNYEITNTEEGSQSYWPRVILTFKLINEDGSLKLSRDEILSENKKKLSELKDFLEMGVINQEEYDERVKIPKEKLKQLIDK